MAERSAALYVLPEYAGALPADRHPADQAGRFTEDLEALRRLSADLGCLLAGGTLVEAAAGGLHNTAPLFSRGRLLGLQRKVHPTPRERARGILPGTGVEVFEADGLRIATLICADVLESSAWEAAAAGSPDIVVVPATSPHRPHETWEAKQARDQSIFAAGAGRAAAFVVKAGAVGTIYGSRLQGRSLIAAPWGEILARIPPEAEDREILLAGSLDLDRLRAWRRSLRRI
jgi:predicted amidohydrolase